MYVLFYDQFSLSFFLRIMKTYPCKGVLQLPLFVHQAAVLLWVPLLFTLVQVIDLIPVVNMLEDHVTKQQRKAQKPFSNITENLWRWATVPCDIALFRSQIHTRLKFQLSFEERVQFDCQRQLSLLHVMIRQRKRIYLMLWRFQG